MKNEEILKRINSIKSELNPIRESVKTLLNELNVLYGQLQVEDSEMPYEVYQIVNIVTSHYGMNHQMIMQKNREKRIKECRQICQYFIKEFYGYKYTLLMIARFTGITNHATIYNSISVVGGLIDSEKKFNKMIIELREKIKIELSKSI
jgi:chromosomal replication initiation ATPase DnaA